VDLDSDRGNVVAAQTLLVYNPLSAPIYINLTDTVPSAAAHDVACPGNAVLAWPIDSRVTRISAVIDYAAGVPGTDVARARIWTSEAALPLFIGPLA
jgi:hypothetical protein